MSNPKLSSGKFERLSQPPVPLVRLTAEHEPDAVLASVGRGERLSRTAVPVVQLVAESPGSVFLELTLAVAPEADTDALFHKVIRLVESLDEFEKALGGAGVTQDQERSKAAPGMVTLVLVPNDLVDAAARLAALGKIANAAVAFGTGVQMRTEVKQPAA